MGLSGILIMLLALCCVVGSVRYKSSETHLLVLSDGSSPARTSSVVRVRRQSDLSNIEIKQFHMMSKIYSRFATVRIDSEVVNTAAEGSQEIAFTVQVPEAAFMSNFTMTVDGTLYVAKVLEKAEAQARYDEARERNQTAGQVKHDRVDPARGMELFTINVNLAPGGTAQFMLTYNELLERRVGTYTQRLFLQPGGIVANLSVRASFVERQGIKSFSFTLPGDDTVYTASTEQAVLLATPDARELTFAPSESVQRGYDAVKGIQGEISIVYDVTHDTGGGVVIVQNEHFVHYFAPPNLPPLPKNILFIIDISGSMSGLKIEKARDAMLKILDDLGLRSADWFNILLFDDKMEKWRSEPHSATRANIDKAKGYVREKLDARGSTDIYGALTTGLNMLLGDRLERNCDQADMIVFLTDGDPTAGVTTDTHRIVEVVTERNKKRASIFSLGFGFNMNFAFLKELSRNNGGFARRIYAAGDASDQLEDFYDEIGTPVLCEVTAEYSNEVVEESQLTLTHFPLYFDGKEIVVAGKTMTPGDQLDPSLMNPRLQGSGANGIQHYSVETDSIQVVQGSEVEDDLTEKLWAYMYIKKLLKDLELLSTEEEKNATRNEALQMALQYSFVTPLTSFSIVVDDTPSSSDDFEMQAKSPFYPQSDRGGMAYAGACERVSPSFMALLILLIFSAVVQ